MYQQVKSITLIVLLTFIVLPQTSISADSKTGVIESAKLYPDREPDGFKGKALEIVLIELVDGKRDIDFVVDIKTKTGFAFTWRSFLTLSPDKPKKKWLKNLHNKHGRGTTDEDRAGLRNEVVPGNIERLQIKIIETVGIFFRKEKIIGTITLNDV